MQNISDQELIQEYQKRTGKLPKNYNAQSPQVSQQPQIPQQGLMGNVGNLLTRLGGGQPEQGIQGTLAKIYAEQQAKSMFQNPLEQQKLQNEVQTGSPEFKLKEATAKNEMFADKEKRLREFEGRRQASGLRQELNNNDYIKRFQSVQSAATGIDSVMSQILSNPDNKSKNVGDQALITLYNKILDPLSVVRESEYARTPDGQALINRIAGFMQKVQAGGSGLTDADRLEIAKAAKVLVNNAGDLYNNKLSEYEGLSGIYGVDPSMVTSGFQKFTPYQIEQIQQAQASTTQQPGQVKQLDANTAKQFLQQAGGDKNKARELARSQGYQF